MTLAETMFVAGCLCWRVSHLSGSTGSTQPHTHKITRQDSVECVKCLLKFRAVVAGPLQRLAWLTFVANYATRCLSTLLRSPWLAPESVLSHRILSSLEVFAICSPALTRVEKQAYVLPCRPWLAPESVLADAGVELGVNYPLPIISLEESRAQVAHACSVIQQSLVWGHSDAVKIPYRPASTANTTRTPSSAPHPRCAHLFIAFWACSSRLRSVPDGHSVSRLPLVRARLSSHPTAEIRMLTTTKILERLCV